MATQEFNKFLGSLIYLFFQLSGRASIYILRTAFGLDWSERIRVIYAGDDATDEDAMLVSYFLRLFSWKNDQNTHRQYFFHQIPS